MKKLFPAISLWICFISSSAHPYLTVLPSYKSYTSYTSVQDTIYIYETVMVYDTIVIRDTVRIRKMPEMPVVQPKNIDATFFSHPAATFSENRIIYSDNSKKSNEQVKTKEMKLNILKYASAAVLAAHTFSGISAQETNPATDEEPLPVMPMQFSIAYPMTSMGDQTKDYRYHVSVNLFSGMVGAVTGIEYGCIVNHVERDMTGVQFAGIGNRTREMTGAQFGGIFNMTSTVTGVQFGGITNMTKDVNNGIQYAGIANISGSVKGIQFAGIANLSENVDYGIQFGGIANLSQNVNGIQFAGIANTAKNVTGIQFGGIANAAESVTGIQFGGIGNLSREVTGMQFAGIFNRTETLRGFQFAGIVNITDTIEKGASIALINIVKKGFYRAWELSFADYMNVGFSFKMGTQKFYTIFSAGATFIEDKLWVTGIGVGNRTALTSRIDFQPEIVGYQYYPVDFRNIRNTNSTHLKLGFVFKLNDRLGVVVTPSIYHIYANVNESEKYYKISPIPPVYEKYRAERHYEFGSGEFIRIPSHIVGFGAGISVGMLFH